MMFFIKIENNQREERDNLQLQRHYNENNIVPNVKEVILFQLSVGACATGTASACHQICWYGMPYLFFLSLYFTCSYRGRNIHIRIYISNTARFSLF